MFLHENFYKSRKYCKIMIKKFFLTMILVVVVFLFIVAFGLVKNVLTQEICTAEDNSCPENFICDINDKKCVQAEKCPEQKPEFCIALYTPVCSNDVEYSNSCVACAAGAKYYYKGKC